MSLADASPAGACLRRGQVSGPDPERTPSTGTKRQIFSLAQNPADAATARASPSHDRFLPSRNFDSLPPQSLRNCTGSATLCILAAMTLPALLPSALQLPAASCLSLAETASSQLQTYAIQRCPKYITSTFLFIITRTADRSAKYGGAATGVGNEIFSPEVPAGAREKGSGRAPEGSGQAASASLPRRGQRRASL